MNWSLIAQIATPISILVSIAIYAVSNSREKKVRAFTEIDALLEANADLQDKDFKKDYLDFVKYVRKVDRFAAEYNGKMLHRKTVKNRIGGFLVRKYDEQWKAIVEQQRKQFSRADYYDSIDKMIMSLKK